MTADLVTPADPAALVQAAFKHIKARDFGAARALVDRALSVAPSLGIVAHARAHLDTDSGATEEGAAYLRDFLGREDPFEGINVHTAWHLAALEFDLGNRAAALDWYERVVGPSVAEYPMTLYSAASLLWRIHVSGWERPLPWESLRPAALAVEKPQGIEALGCAIAFITNADDAALVRLVEGLGAQDTAEVLIPIIEAYAAFWRRDYRAAVTFFRPLAPSFSRLSTFPEQIIPVEETYQAALRLS